MSMRSHGLERTLVQETIDVKKSRERPPMRFLDNIERIDRLSLLEPMELINNRKTWRQLVSNGFMMVGPATIQD